MVGRASPRDWPVAEPTFHYRPGCAAPGCARPPAVQLAASWSYGPLRERKNYGLACAEHREALLERARARRRALAVGDGEQVGPVEAIPLPGAGRRDDRSPGMDPTA